MVAVSVDGNTPYQHTFSTHPFNVSSPLMVVQGPCMRGGGATLPLPLPQPLTLPNYDPNSVFVLFLDLDPALLIQEPCMRGGTIGAPS